MLFILSPRQSLLSTHVFPFFSFLAHRTIVITPFVRLTHHSPPPSTLLKTHFVATIHPTGTFSATSQFSTPGMTFVLLQEFPHAFPTLFLKTWVSLLHAFPKQANPKSSSGLITHTTVLYSGGVQNFVGRPILPPATASCQLGASVQQLSRPPKSALSAAVQNVYWLPYIFVPW